jgi:translation initiation factor 2B subunit (eIF-2B alpha/beta/delta family)
MAFNAHSFLPQDSPDPNPKIFSSAIRCKATKRTQTSKKDSETVVATYSSSSRILGGLKVFSLESFPRFTGAQRTQKLARRKSSWNITD